LRLGAADKRKLAPVQAYCAYAWDLGLRDTVISEWNKEKRTYMLFDDEDPAPGSSDTLDPGSHIPLAFKLKVAKEAYGKLSEEEKKEVDCRREQERDKLYRLVTEITDVEERNKKLLSHEK